jgi:hypothetical protein
MLVPTLSALASRVCNRSDSVLLAASDRSLCPMSCRGSDQSRKKPRIRSMSIKPWRKRSDPFLAHRVSNRAACRE